MQGPPLINGPIYQPQPSINQNQPPYYGYGEQPYQHQEQYQNQTPIYSQPVMQPSFQPPVTEASSFLYMGDIDQLLIKQKVEIKGKTKRNRYVITNSMGQQFLYATQIRSENSQYEKYRFYDNYEANILKISRDTKYCPECCCWCPNCLEELHVRRYDDELLGVVYQLPTFRNTPKFVITDHTKQNMLFIKGPSSAKTAHITYFQIFNSDKSVQIGEISKLYAGDYKERYTKADNFSVSFPIDLAISMKATLLGATLLLDLMYYNEEVDV